MQYNALIHRVKRSTLVPLTVLRCTYFNVICYFPSSSGISRCSSNDSSCILSDQRTSICPWPHTLSYSIRWKLFTIYWKMLLLIRMSLRLARSKFVGNRSELKARRDFSNYSLHVWYHNFLSLTHPLSIFLWIINRWYNTIVIYLGTPYGSHSCYFLLL